MSDPASQRELPPNVSVLSTLDPGDDAYRITDLAALRALSQAEERHFWHVSRNEYVAQRLERLGIAPPARILDLGCGGGCVSAALARRGYDVVGVDGHLPRLVEAARRAPTARFIAHDLRNGLAPIASRASEFAAVALLDVIEHTDDPAALLRDALGLVRPGGWLVGTVPALMSLWSEIDASSGHRLRYHRDGLRAVLAPLAAGNLEVVDFNRSLVPLLWLQRRALRLGSRSRRATRNLAIPPRPLNATLRALLSLERALSALLDRTSLPGASLWFAVRRSARS